MPVKASMAKLTLWVSNDTKNFGKAIARRRHESLSRLVSEYLERLREAELHPSKKTPIVNRLSGIISGGPMTEDEYYKHLEEKYR